MSGTPIPKRMETAASAHPAPGRHEPAFPVLTAEGQEVPSPARQALGLALMARADQVARLVSERAFPGVETDEQAFFTSALATRLVGRWLATGEVANADEHER